MNDISLFIKKLDVDENIKKKLYEINTENYIGNAKNIF